MGRWSIIHIKLPIEFHHLTWWIKFQSAGECFWLICVMLFVWVKLDVPTVQYICVCCAHVHLQEYWHHWTKRVLTHKWTARQTTGTTNPTSALSQQLNLRKTVETCQIVVILRVLCPKQICSCAQECMHAMTIWDNCNLTILIMKIFLACPI